MIGAVIDVAAAVFATAAVMVLPGLALLALLRLDRVVAPLLRPAAAVAGTIAMTSVALVVTLWAGWSLAATMLMVGSATVVVAVAALLRWEPAIAPRRSMRERTRAAAAYLPPTLVLVVLGVFDAPHVRSDTYWHVALARKLGAFDQLSSAKVAFEAGVPGNANYPLPSWHALVAMADHAPRVDLWSATWFLTLWLGPVAMLAFGGMASVLVGDRRAALAGSWTFVAVVVLGYGPYFFATRYLSYAGQVAIYLLLPLAIAAMVGACSARGRRRAGQVGVACASTLLIGLLHGNYVMYPVLFAAGGAVLMLVGARERWRGAAVTAAAVGVTGALALAVQLPWISDDDNFARGGGDPSGEPTAFIRHRDVFAGSEESHHVVLGSLATQPLLLLGALAIPVLLLLGRRRPGPWHLAGGAVAIVAFARSPQAIELIDRLGTVTPATRFDRVYPAAVGVLVVALGVGWLLSRAWARGRARGATATAIALAGAATATWWADSIRDTTRIVVTPFVEARWVGGLDPTGLPRLAVIAGTAATLFVAAGIRWRARGRDVEDEPTAGEARVGIPDRHLLATLVLVAVVGGLAPATIDRAHATWRPEAYRRDLRNDRVSTLVEVYPPAARTAVRLIEPGSVVLAAFDDTRRIASLAPVYSIEESVLRDISAAPPAAGRDAADQLEQLVTEWDADYVAGSTGFGPSVRSFQAMLDAAAADPEHYEAISAGSLRLFRVRR